MSRTLASGRSYPLLLILFLGIALNSFAQNASISTTVPRLISFSGIVNGANGKPFTSPVAITFSAALRSFARASIGPRKFFHLFSSASAACLACRGFTTRRSKS